MSETVITERKPSRLFPRLARRMGMIPTNEASSSDPSPAPEEPARSNPPAAAPSQRLLSADDLFVGEKEILIQNGSDIYRLRRTRNGKLILCK